MFIKVNDNDVEFLNTDTIKAFHIEKEWQEHGSTITDYFSIIAEVVNTSTECRYYYNVKKFGSYADANEYLKCLIGELNIRE